VDAALSAVHRARQTLEEKTAAHARIVRLREVKQGEYDQQRNSLFEPSAHTDASDHTSSALMQREHNLGLLLEQLAYIDERRFAAWTEVETAQAALRAAVQLHQRLQTKLDMLIERKKLWRMDQQRASDARDEIFAEESFLAQQLRGKQDASTPSRH
jgi:hypothetical protein